MIIYGLTENVKISSKGQRCSSKSRKRKLDSDIGISKKPKLEKEEKNEESLKKEEMMTVLFLIIIICFKIKSCKNLF